jgi:hypothetical protein
MKRTTLRAPVRNRASLIPGKVNISTLANRRTTETVICIPDPVSTLLQPYNGKVIPGHIEMSDPETILRRD